MAIDLIVVPEAEQDIAEAYIWAGLGEEFLSAVDACVETIRRWPKIYPFVHEKYRRALTRRFPYAVFYEVSDETVTVFGLFHNARDPTKWRQRLSSSHVLHMEPVATAMRAERYGHRAISEDTGFKIGRRMKKLKVHAQKSRHLDDPGDG